MPIRVLPWAAATGVAVALLVVGHQPGLGLALAALILWAPALPELVRRRALTPLLCAGLGIALAAVSAIRDSEWVVVLSLMASFGISAVAATSARSALGIGLAVPGLPVGVARALHWGARSVTASGADRVAAVLRSLRTFAVTTALVVVFGLLLASADVLFATLIPQVDLGRLPAYVVVGVVAALATLTAVALVTSPPPWAAGTLPRLARARRIEWFVPVLAVVVVMAVFLGTQVVAALGGNEYVQRTVGLTYASYARQGFGQLVAVTALTLLVVGWFAIRAPRTDRRDAWTTRAALGALCLAALGIVATALYRMSLYVAAYGLTELRILATTGEIVMGLIVLMVMAAGVRWHGGWLPVAIVQLSAVAMLGLALANPEAMIVRYNAQAAEVPLDLHHLGMLSADAVPAIAALDEPLRSCVLGQQDVQVDPSVWGWNLGRARAVGLDDVTDMPASCAAVVR